MYVQSTTCCPIQLTQAQMLGRFDGDVVVGVVQQMVDLGHTHLPPALDVSYCRFEV